LGSDFHVKIDPRFCDQNRIPILVLKSVSDFHLLIVIMIAIENLIWIDQGSIFNYKSKLNKDWI